MRKLKELFQVKRILTLILAAAMTVTSLPAAASAAPVTDIALSETEEASVPEADGVEEPDSVQPESMEEPDSVQPESMEADGAQPDEMEIAAEPVMKHYSFEYDENNLAGYTTAEYFQGQPRFTDPSASGAMAVNNAVLQNIRLVNSENKDERYSLADTWEDIVKTVTYSWKKQDQTGNYVDLKNQDGAETAPADFGRYQLIIKLPAKENEYEAVEAAIDFEIKKAVVEIAFDLIPAAPGSPVSAIKESLEDFTVTASDGTEFRYTADDPDTQDTDESQTSDLKFIKWDIHTVQNGNKSDTPLNDTDILNKTEEYVLAANAAFTDKVTNADNYEIKDCEVKTVLLGSLKETRIEITLTDKWADEKYAREELVPAADETRIIPKITVKTYDTKAVADLVKDTDYTAAVKEVEWITGEDGSLSLQKKDIAGAVTETAGRWYTADCKSWTENKKKYCNLMVGGELEGAPCDAGTYVYRITYPGEKGLYDESYADIIIEIKAAELIIKPELKKNTFYRNQSAADVLAQISYQVYGKDGSPQPDINEAIKKTDSFWGTSHWISNKTVLTQPYEPVFTIYETKTTITKDTDGSVINEEKQIRALSPEETLQFSSTVDNTSYEYSYEIRFSGKKSVYRYDNDYTSAIETVDINKIVDSSNPGYQVITDEDTLKANTVVFEVTDAVMVTVNTDEITENTDFVKKTLTFTDETTNETKNVYTIYSKIFDSENLYENRADYKKAKVVDETGKIIVPGVDSSITYKWYRANSYTDAVDIQEALVQDEKPLEYASWYGVSGVSPYSAGVYKLEITYDNSQTGYYAVKPTAEIYFEIEKQQVKAVPDKPEAGYTAFTNTTVASFIAETGTAGSSVKKLDGTQWTDTGWLADENYYQSGAWSDGTYYALQWEVQKETDVPAENGGTVKEWITIENPSGTYFEKDANYRLAVSEMTVRSSNYTDFVHSFDEETKTGKYTYLSTDTVPITVEEMGSVQLKLHTGSEELISTEKVYDGISVFEDADLSAKLAAIKVTEIQEGQETAPFTLEGLTLTYKYNDADNNRMYSILPEEAVDGGTYLVYASFKGDRKYAPLTDENGETEILVAQAKITKRKVKVSAPSEITVTAGTQVSVVKSENRSKLIIEGVELPAEGADRGIVAKDREAFTYNYYYAADAGSGYDDKHFYGYPAWSFRNQPQLGVYDRRNNSLTNRTVIKYGTEYELKLASLGSLRGAHTRNYELETGKSGKINVERGASSISSVAYKGTDAKGTIEKINSVSSRNKLTHTFTALNGIKYSSYYNDEQNKTLSGNFVAVRIQAPDEYESSIPDTAIYRKSIEEAGGYIAVESSNNGFITVIFDASKGDQTFVIRWEEDYVETFNLKFPKDFLLEDLTRAVAPKTIAFNSPDKKMVVGAIQNLDVKLTKVQKDDVICLAYKVSDKSVLSVSDNGKVVALKPGTATVTVYPVYLENGIKTQIPNAKSADVKITVTEVSAPRITKVTAWDNSALIQYPYVADSSYYTYGYRREIYVQKVSDKAWTAKEFEQKITDMPNGQWQDIFAVEPVFLTNTNEYGNRIYDSKKHSYTNVVGYEIDGLEPSAQYNVYVRNVSLIRTLPDGSEVVKSAQGSVKTFTTTKAQIDGLTGLLHDKTGKQLKESLYRKDEIHDENGFETGGIVELERPAGFYDVYQNYFDNEIQYEVDFLEGKVNLVTKGWIFDTVEEKMASAEQSGTDYIAPKLAFYFLDTATSYVYDAFSGERVSPGDQYRTTSVSCASINKKGQITLKQTGSFCVVAVDTNTGIQSNEVNVRVTAQVTGIKGKSTSMETGQTLYLADLLIYQSGKKTLKGWGYTRNVTITDQDLKEEIEKDGYFKVSDDGKGITALKAGGSRTFELTDSAVQKSAQVTIKSKPLSPVKNLKLTNVIDRRFTISFEGSFYADGYRIEVVNARGKVIKNIYVRTNDTQNSNWDYRYEYNGKTGRYYGDYVIDTGLTQQSKYSVKVTALYGEEASKTVTKSGSTTKLPAADYGLTDTSMNTGADGTVIKLLNSSFSGIHNNNFISGNSYTLIANPANPAAKYAATDKLTWSSSDKKTATVKVNTGTYSATLKALKAGTTIIEVKSSVLKCVIARYRITVRTVGDAYASNSYYYGDNEDLRGDGERPGESYTKLTLGIAAPADLASGEYKWFTFTAAEEGTYGFYRMYNGNRSETGFSVYNANGSSINKTCVLDKGQTVYVKATASGSYTLHVERKRGSGQSERMPVILGENILQVTAGQWFVFTADQKGLYSFTNNGYIPFAFYKNLNDTEEVTRGASIKYWLEEGETVYMQAGANGTNAFTMTVGQIQVTPLTADSPAVSTGSGNEKAWFSFVVPADAEYEFALTARGTIALYCSPNAADKIEQSTGSVSMWLSKGKTVLAEVPSNNELSLTTKTAVEGIETGKTVTTSLSGSYSYLSFLAPEAGIYQFSSGNTDGAESYLITDLEKTNDGSYLDNNTVYSGNFCIDHYLEAGTKVYLKVRSNTGVQDNISIKVTKKTPVPITAENTSVTIAAGLTEWFSFSADVKNTLIFNSQGFCEKYFYETLDSKGAYKGDFSSSNSTEFYDPSAGTVYYKVRNTGNADTTVTVRAKKYTIEPVTDKLTVKIESGLEQWFSFTAEEEAEYGFSFSSDAASCRADYWYEDPEGRAYNTISFSDGNGASTTNMFTANEKKYIKIKNNGSNDTNVTIKAKKNVTIPIINGSAEAELYANRSSNNASKQIFSFTSGQDARYFFSFTSDTDADARLYKDENLNDYLGWEDFSPENDDSEGGRGTYYAAHGDYYVAKGETVYWKIENQNRGLDTVVTVKAEAVPVTAIPADGLEDVALVSGIDQWFSFTADSGEDARYTFLFTGSTGTKAYFYRTADASDYEGYGVYLNGGQKSDERYVAAGQTVYWKTEAEQDDTFAVKVRKVEVNDWPEQEESVTEGADSEKLYKFTAADSGRYIFKIYGQKSFKAVLYSALDDLSPETISVNYTNPGYAAEINRYVAANEPLYIKVENHAAEEISFTLNKEMISYNPWPSESDSIEMEAGSAKWYAFTAPESGRYTFTLTGDADFKGYLYPSLEENKTIAEFTSYLKDSLNVGTAECYIEAGNTVCFKAVNSDSSNVNHITFKAAVIIPHILTAEENSVIDFDVQAYESEWAYFEAPATGMYKFSAAYESGDGYLARYGDMKSENHIDRVNIYGSNPEGDLVYYLEKGKACYIRVYPYSYSYAFKGAIQAELVSEAEKLELDTAAPVSIDTTVAKYQLFEFTAEKEGSYRFYSEGSEDSKAWFFWNLDVKASNSMNSASDYYDDNSGTGSNFSKKVSMNAGQTIQVLIGRGSGNGNLTTTVYVEKFEEMASIPLTLNESSPLNVETGTYQWYSFKALADGDYIFYSDYNDGDPKAWFFNDTSVGGEASVETLNSACQSDGYGSDDDDGNNIMGIGNANFAKKISMRQGQTVYIAVGHYSLNGSVTASIHVIQSNE